jgi:hypothetical protein
VLFQIRAMMHVLNLQCAGGIRNLPTLHAAPLRRTSLLVTLKAFSPLSRQHRSLFSAQAAVLDAPRKHATRKTGFESLGLGEDLMAAVSEHRFEAPTEIQVRSGIPSFTPVVRGASLEISVLSLKPINRPKFLIC